ncbi:bifunctional ADP-dependent NAD(P)H-hydrate dehydratase/NAD(P)H-hydrate epimerase [Rhodobacter sp.]
MILCGPGNNGGDGFVVARLLKERGWSVEVFLYGDAGRMPADARVNHERWCGMGEVHPARHLNRSHLDGAALAVDAVFGTGLSRSVPAGVWGSLAMVQESRVRLVAVDILSGICADSGRVISAGGYIDCPADLTVTFERAKCGHGLDMGARLSGRVHVVPIGLDSAMDALLRTEGADAIVDQIAASSGRLGKREGHKFSYGHAVVLAGPSGRGGAARLSARGALRVGAGLVTLGCPPDAIAENAARMDAVMLRPVADAGELARTLEDPRINALCLGPGMGTGARQAALVEVTLRAHRATVLDADALTVLSQRQELVAALHDRCVLTPHAGEFGRLFPDIAAKLAGPAVKGPAYSKVDATCEAAKRAGCVVLFKGPDTVIATPDGQCAINSAAYERVAPWLATAGSGDVLAGFITGLLARGFSPFDAACKGAWLHVECARSFGPGLIAEDLPEELPKVFRALGL